MTIVGELKSGRKEKEEFSNEEKGQMDSFLSELLHYQPHRSFATGFLSDGRIIKFFRLLRNKKHLEKKKSLYFSRNC